MRGMLHERRDVVRDASARWKSAAARDRVRGSRSSDEKGDVEGEDVVVKCDRRRALPGGDLHVRGRGAAVRVVGQVVAEARRRIVRSARAAHCAEWRYLRG